MNVFTISPQVKSCSLDGDVVVYNKLQKSTLLLSSQQAQAWQCLIGDSSVNGEVKLSADDEYLIIINELVELGILEESKPCDPI